MIENDTWYRCSICGREGRVGRCCSDENRTPLNALAKAEQELLFAYLTIQSLEAEKLQLAKSLYLAAKDFTSSNGSIPDWWKDCKEIARKVLELESAKNTEQQFKEMKDADSIGDLCRRIKDRTGHAGEVKFLPVIAAERGKN